jgi:hypothetical protein
MEWLFRQFRPAVSSGGFIRQCRHYSEELYMPNLIRPFFVLMVLFLAISTSASAAVVINEIMYNSPGLPDVEWVELYNSGDIAVELDDWYLLDDNAIHPICLLSGVLLPGNYLVVVGDFTLFNARYPGVTNTNINAFDPGGAGFGLGNTSDSVLLYDDDGMLRDNVTYFESGDWPGSADGDGPSLELVSPYLENNVGSAWDPSLVIYGTPGQINSTFTDNQAPTIHDTDREPRLPEATDIVLITALVTDQEGLAGVELFLDTGAGFVAQTMFDDGAHGDGAPADSLFGAAIAPLPDGSLIRYYVQATDAIGQVTTKPSTAPVAYHAYTVGHTIPHLMVSEIVANNITGIVDEMGQHEDWAEIYNFGFDAVDLTGMYLTDNLGDHRKWMLPAVILQPGEFQMVWCDGQPEQGANHASFSLSSTGEEIGLYDNEDDGNTLIDGFVFGLMGADISYGMVDWPTGLPDNNRSGSVSQAMGHEYYGTPSPGVFNEPVFFSDIVINEFQTTSVNGGVDDWVEFYNRGTLAVDISGYWVSDNSSLPMRWSFPGGTILQPGGLYVVSEISLGFSFSSLGEEVMLTAADGITGLDFYSFGPQLPDVSVGRYAGGSPYWSTFTLATPGSANPSMSSPVFDDSTVPTALHIGGAYPNPFNPSTTISFSIPQSGEVHVQVYSLDGRLVRTINAGILASGTHQIPFNGLDDFGRPLSSGTWFAKVRSGSASDVVKMMLVK